MQKSITSQEYIKTNQVLTLALTTGTALFIAVGVYLQYSGNITLYSADSKSFLFSIIYPLFCVAIIGGSFIVSRKLIEKAISLPQLSEKLRQYRTGILIQFAMLEGASILLVLGYWFTNEILMLGTAGGAIMLMVQNIQNQGKIIQDLQLTGEDMVKMQNPAAIVMTQEVSEDA